MKTRLNLKANSEHEGVKEGGDTNGIYVPVLSALLQFLRLNSLLRFRNGLKVSQSKSRQNRSNFEKTQMSHLERFSHDLEKRFR